MMTFKRLRQVVSGVSFGGFRPRIDVSVTEKTTSTETAPAILIGIDTVDSSSCDNQSIRLHECFIAPDLDDVQLAVWIKERCQDVILHEMDEFFRFRDAMVQRPVHPVAEGTFDDVRKRRRA